MNQILLTFILLCLSVLGAVPIVFIIFYETIKKLWKEKHNSSDLLQKLDKILVLRSTCSDSHEGKFRVHLPEQDWDEIQKLVKELREKN